MIPIYSSREIEVGYDADGAVLITRTRGGRRQIAFLDPGQAETVANALVVAARKACP